jgi:hypothetical protein
VEGGVFAIYRANTPLGSCDNNGDRSGSGGGDRSSGGGGSSLSVNKPDQLRRVATAAGFAFCAGVTRAGAPCRAAVDAATSRYCAYHALVRV